MNHVIDSNGFCVRCKRHVDTSSLTGCISDIALVDKLSKQCEFLVKANTQLREDSERLRSTLKAHIDAIDAQPWASEEPIGVLLNNVTARLSNAEARVKELEAEFANIRALANRRNKEDHSKDTTLQLVSALDNALDNAMENKRQLEAENAKLSEHCRNQAERIRYLEGATNHATGTPLSSAEKRVKELESALRAIERSGGRIYRTDCGPLHCNGSWCAEQARATLAREGGAL